VTLLYQNSSTGQSYDAGGSYFTYTRFYLPSDITITSATLDGIAIPVRDRDQKTHPPIPYIEAEEVSASGYILGVAFSVPAASERKLSISYRRGTNLPLGAGSAQLELFQQKQPGQTDIETQTVINYPTNMIAAIGIGDSPHSFGFNELSTVQPSVANAGQLEYNTVLSRDLRARIFFTKQQ